MKQRKCPYKGDLCFDYGTCEDCEWSTLIIKYEKKITRLKKRVEKIENKLRYKDGKKKEITNTDEVKEKYAVNTAVEAMEMIIGLGYDYDGFSNEKDLKDLIDELVELAVLAKGLIF